MPGGSAEPDDPEEEDQCQHCGQWFTEAGVLSHEEHCPWSKSDRRMFDLEAAAARLRAGLGPELEGVAASSAPSWERQNTPVEE
jgi:hypothetical protein